MSVLFQMSIFPTDKTESKSKEVSEVIRLIRDSGFTYQLTSMSTIVETNDISQAFSLVEKCYKRLEELGSKRVYITLNFDIRVGAKNRIDGKIISVEKHIGRVSK